MKRSLHLALSCLLGLLTFAAGLAHAAETPPPVPNVKIDTWPDGEKVCDRIRKMTYKNWVYPILLTFKSGKTAEVYLTTNVADYHNLVLGEKNFWETAMVGDLKTCFVSRKGALYFESIEK